MIHCLSQTFSRSPLSEFVYSGGLPANNEPKPEKHGILKQKWDAIIISRAEL